jgi:hypothetical protein
MYPVFIICPFSEIIHINPAVLDKTPIAKTEIAGEATPVHHMNNVPQVKYNTTLIVNALWKAGYKGRTANFIKVE